MSTEKRARELIAEWRERQENYDEQQSAESKKGYEVDWTCDARARSFEQAADELEALIDSAALTPQWQPISTAPRDGTMHLRGLWVQQHTRDGVVTNWEVYHGFENQDGDFVDAKHGDDHGWPANEYDAWLPLPAPPERE